MSRRSHSSFFVQKIYRNDKVLPRLSESCIESILVVKRQHSKEWKKGRTSWLSNNIDAVRVVNHLILPRNCASTRKHARVAAVVVVRAVKDNHPESTVGGEQGPDAPFLP